MAKNSILGPPSESTGAQNGAQNLTFPPKSRKKTPHGAPCWRSWNRLASQRPPEAFQTSFLSIFDAFRDPQSLIFMIFMTLASILKAKIANRGPHSPIELMQKICQDLPEIVRNQKCAHTTLRTKTTDLSTQAGPKSPVAAVTAARHRSIESAAPLVGDHGVS